jgi:hypothetical protein
VNGGAAVTVRLNQQEIPDGVQRVDFDLEVRVRVPVGVDEDFDVVVLKNDGIARVERRPELRFFEVGPEVQKLVVPEHPDASGERRAPRAVDIDKRIGPRRSAPRRLRQPSVDLQGRGRPIADRAARSERKLLEIRWRWGLALQRHQGQDAGRRHRVQSQHLRTLRRTTDW